MIAYFFHKRQGGAMLSTPFPWQNGILLSYDIIFPLLLKLVKWRWRDKDPGNEVDNGLDNCRHSRSLPQLIVNNSLRPIRVFPLINKKDKNIQHLYCVPWFCFTLPNPRGRGGYSRKIRRVCAAKGLVPWPYLRINQTKIDTLSKAQTRKMTPYAGEEQKGDKRCWRSKHRLIATEKQNLFKIALVIP